LTEPVELGPKPDCPACAAWTADHKTGRYEPGCEDCMARAIARSPAAWLMVTAQTDVEIKQAVRRAWPERSGHGRTLVWKWIELLGLKKAAP